MEKMTKIAAAINLARKWLAPKQRHAAHALSVQRSNRPPGSFPRNRPSSVRQAVVSLVRWWRRTAADDHWLTMNIHQSDGML